MSSNRLITSTQKNAFTILAKYLREQQGVPIRTKKQMIQYSGVNTIQEAIDIFSNQYNDEILEKREQKKIEKQKKKKEKKQKNYLFTGVLRQKKSKNIKGQLTLLTENVVQVPLMTKQRLDELIIELSQQDDYVIEIINETYEVEVPKEEYKNIIEAVIKEAGAMDIDGFIPNKVWCKNEGTCVPDYLTYKYNDPKMRFKKCVKDYETIERLSCYKNDNQIYFNEPNKYGYTLKNVKLFCENTGMSLYVLHNGKIIIEERTKKDYPLVIEVKNNHLYPIENKDLINSISKRNIQSNIVHQEHKTTETKYKEKIFMTEDYDDAILFALKIMKENNLQVYNGFRMGNNTLMNYKLNGNLYITTHKCELIKDFVELQGEDYTGQNPIQYITPLLDCLPSSFLNQEVQEALLTKGVKHRTHLGLYQEIDEGTNLLPPVDINKAYRFVMENPLDDFMTIDFNSQIEEYDYNPLRVGLYYVETNDLTLLHQSNWYSNTIIQEALDNNIKMKIKYYIKGKRENKNILKIVIDMILEMADYSTYKDVLKFMINSISGLLGKTETTNTKLYVDNDEDRVWESYFKNKGGDESLIFREFEGLFAYGTQSKNIKLSNNLPMYIQILDWANIKLHRLILELGGYENLYYRKTDCVVMKNIGQKLNPTDDVGGYSYEENKDIETFKVMNTERHIHFTKSKNKLTPNKDITNSDDYKKIIQELENGKSLMLNAKAGTGKSYCIDKVNDYFIEKGMSVQKIAFTNKASLKIKGQTIHRLLCIDKNGVSNQKQLEKKMKKCGVICIDEISMINKSLWKQLFQLKRKYPNIPFLLCGDPRQLPPVEDENIDYFNHSTIHYICDYNVAELKFFEKCRYDKKLYDYLEKISLEQKLDIDIPVNNFNINTKKGTNICFSNNRRKHINKLYNDKIKETKQNEFLPYEDVNDKYNQPFYIYEGLPLIANKTINDEGIMKNETFTIMSVDFEKKTFIIDLDEKSFKFGDIHKLFTICYCMTTHKSQGDTISGELNIHEYNLISKDKRIFYTAVSRATSIEKINYFF